MENAPDAFVVDVKQLEPPPPVSLHSKTLAPCTAVDVEALVTVPVTVPFCAKAEAGRRMAAQAQRTRPPKRRRECGKRQNVRDMGTLSERRDCG
jgi:hypothetical protein